MVATPGVAVTTFSEPHLWCSLVAGPAVLVCTAAADAWLRGRLTAQLCASRGPLNTGSAPPCQDSWLTPATQPSLPRCKTDTNFPLVACQPDSAIFDSCSVSAEGAVRGVCSATWTWSCLVVWQVQDLPIALDRGWVS